MEGNMEYIILIVLLVIVGCEFYEINQKYKEREKKVEKKVEKPKLSKEEQKKQEELRKNFQELMDYDYEKALKRK